MPRQSATCAGALNCTGALAARMGIARNALTIGSFATSSGCAAIYACSRAMPSLNRVSYSRSGDVLFHFTGDLI